MYIQYEDEKGEYYCLDLFENPLDMFLLSYSWIKPRKLYKMDRKYLSEISEKIRKKRAKMQPFAIISGMLLYKVFRFETGVLFYLNYLQSIIFYILTFVAVILILFLI